MKRFSMLGQARITVFMSSAPSPIAITLRTALGIPASSNARHEGECVKVAHRKVIEEVIERGRINTGRASATSSKIWCPKSNGRMAAPAIAFEVARGIDAKWMVAVRKRAHVTVSTSNAVSDPVIPDLSGLPFTCITYLTLLPPTSSLPTTSHSLQVLPTGESLLLENGDEGATDQDCSLYKEVLHAGSPFSLDGFPQYS
ncbi:hypothetical protein DFH08DRAFT_825305 [Mycena albidolilacea]|uniref:Uncharacterized protein n=1 Tax=Mycena albidolilacea TaxID=1033008 RepID=A0AAD6Z2N6_9AGAR|nr:hypothetical protein DFH08DRAFT_825305 [Mycena albidolilacea]